METTFLQRFAQEIHEKHPDNLDQLCFVFPSKRSGLFFKKELAKLKNKPFWSPQILTIETFIEDLSGIQTIGPLEQIFHLYEVHQKMKIVPQMAFAQFIDTAKIILADFNDIDMALADYRKLFANVKEYVKLENWSPNDPGNSQLAKKYIKAFENLPVYYEAYCAKLINEKIGYQGLVYRYLKNKVDAKQTENILASLQKWDMVYVAGLNALTNAEKWLFDWINSQGKLDVYFDAENQMIDDKDQESGRFIRKFAKEKRESFRWSTDRLTNSKKKIDTYAVNGNLAMARMVGKLIDNPEKKSNGSDTAIILADEGLLMPVLESLPHNIGDVNVTLGFSLGMTSFMSFSEQVFSMQSLAKIQGGVLRFYFKDVLKVLTNPILVSVYGVENDFQSIIHEIVSQNKVWIEDGYLLDKINSRNSLKGFEMVFSDWKEFPLNSLSYLNYTIDRFQEYVEKSGVSDDILAEQLYFFKTSLSKLKDYINRFEFDLNLDAIKKIFKQVVGSLQVPFSGEPLSGIQIMGLLETRLLSFKNIIFVSVNEGIIPSKGGSISYLPFELRSVFNIQTHRDRDSLFAYHFYRILSQADNISLIYDTSSDGVGSKEKSRFIRQIEQEWPEKSADIKFEQHIGVFEQEKLEVSNSIEKSPEVIANIKKYLVERGLSPSALNNFIESPFDFYYKNVIGVNEAKTVDEDMEHNTFGTIVHACLEKFYTPFEKKVLKAAELNEAFKKIDRIITKEFTDVIPNMSNGKHYLSYYSVQEYVNRFIKLDIKFIETYNFPITLNKNELALSYSKEMHGLPIKFKGFADRVETRKGIQYIIDYKTGSVKDGDLKVEDFTDLRGKHKPKLLQLLMYAWLAQKELKAGKVVSGIYSLRETKFKLYTAKVGGQAELSENDLQLFESYLEDVIEEMLDSSIPLKRNVDYKFSLF